jgi:endonuclease YncB( thermonuclease family)
MKEETLVRKNSEKIKPLTKMVGKRVKVLSGDGWWSGEVAQVLDGETLLVLKNNKLEEVSIFDVRSA